MKKRTEKEAKQFIERLKIVQENTKEGEYVLPCPRCGHGRMEARAVKNSLSRHADVYVCNICGMDEAIRDMAGSPLPLNEWSMAISFGEEE